VVGLPLLGRPSKRPGGFIEGGLELCERPERKASNTSGGNKLKRKPKMARTYLRLGHAAPRLRPGLRLGLLQGLQPGFRPQQPGPEIGLAHRRPGRTPTAVLETSARAAAASARAAAASALRSAQSNRWSATSVPCWERRAVAPASEVLRDRSEPQISTSWRMNDDLAALRSVRS
jgi:hypothetical protein